MTRKILMTITVLAMSFTMSAQPRIEEFQDVPIQYHPRVWWHWMNGNVTRDGIRKDILWMNRVGIAGFHNFDAGLGTPQIVEKRLTYMTPEWKDAFNYALDLADSLGMEVSIASSPGWSVTGGPWVSEEDAEKKVTWRDTTVIGGYRFHGRLPDPIRACGEFQDEFKYPDDLSKNAHYRDLYVIAVKVPSADTARILKWKVKAGFEMDYKVSDHFPTPATDDCTSLKDVIDLTDRFKDGILDWKVPSGNWKIFRFGYNLIGRVNGPASPEATGLEVDKLDKDAVKRYYETYLGMYKDASEERLGKAIKGLMIDSYESGKCTWTPKMEQEFKARRGYDLRPWMPVLTGQIIGSSEESERFLFDWRQTLGELFTENHYDIVNDILKEYGMFRHTEAHEERTAFVGDGMMVKRNADIPMSAFWIRFRAGWHSTYPGAEADLRESSSVAHIYGQNICAAESFTTNGSIGKWDGFGAYQCYPGNLKPVADAAMANGLNRFIIHTSVHQPVDDKIPGLGLGVYGQWFNRHDTWAEEAKPWIDYLSRSCYMLQQGKNVADIAYFYGEDKNLTGRFYNERVSIPEGWNYDFVNADIIRNVLKINGNSLVTDSGMDYKILVIDKEVRYMSLPLLRRLLEIADAGVAICGPRPSACANLNASDKEFRKIVSQIWDSGRKNIFEDGNIATALASIGVSKDVEQLSNASDSVKFVHRRLQDGDIYWIANISSSYRDMEVSLRTAGKKPMIWHADTGTVEPAGYSIDGTRTSVTLHFTPNDSQFIVLTEDTDVRSFSIPAASEICIGEVGGPWNVRFQEGRGVPESVRLDRLMSLTDSPVDGIRYFSGTATYTSEFEFSKTSGRILLDLGKVGNIAHVYVNSKDLGLLWKTPYKTDITDALVEGSNHLEIRVTDSWANRLIGDAKPEEREKITWTAKQFYQATDDPVPSGLMGPVKIISSRYGF